MEKDLLKRIENLGIKNPSKLNKMVQIFNKLMHIERESREVASCDEDRLLEMRDQFLGLVELEINPYLAELLNESVTMRVLVEQLEIKVLRRLINPLKTKSRETFELRIPLEDALGSMIFEIRFLILNMVVNHPECLIHDPHRVYVLLYPEVEKDIQNTGMLYNILNQLYQDLSRFLSFESLPESYIPRSLKKNPSLWTKNIQIWDYIREIFKSGKLIRPETWSAIGHELQNLIRSGEGAINEWGSMMRLSDRVDFEEKIQQFHKFSYDLAQCHVQCLSHFKKQNFDLITPADMRQMVDLTIKLDETVSELQHFLRIWMRHLEARTCLHYTVVLQTIENDSLHLE